MSHKHVISDHVSVADLMKVIEDFKATENFDGVVLFVTEAEKEPGKPAYQKEVDPEAIKAKGSSLQSVLNNTAYQLNQKNGVTGNGTRSPRTHSEGGTKTSGEKTSAVWKLAAEFDVDGGTVALTLGKIGDGDNAVPAIATFAANADNPNAGDIAYDIRTGRYFGKKIQMFTANPREALIGAVELQAGKPVTAGWKLGDYVSTIDDQAKAQMDIFQQAGLAKDIGFITQYAADLLTGAAPIEKTGESIKADWLDMWLPEPIKLPEPEPEKKPGEVGAQPTEKPASKAEVMKNSEVDSGQSHELNKKNVVPNAPVAQPQAVVAAIRQGRSKKS
jgi:hypothetical protein